MTSLSESCLLTAENKIANDFGAMSIEEIIMNKN
jgi:hypothetical protein